MGSSLTGGLPAVATAATNPHAQNRWGEQQDFPHRETYAISHNDTIECRMRVGPGSAVGPPWSDAAVDAEGPAGSARRRSIQRLKRTANGREHPLDLAFGDDQRRRKHQRVAATANQNSFVEAAVGGFRAARSWRAVARFEVDRRQ